MEVRAGSKNQPGVFDCYSNAEPDEPMFIVLARDATAPLVVEMWAAERELAITRGEKPMSDIAVVSEARQCAKNMREWRKLNRKSP